MEMTENLWAADDQTARLAEMTSEADELKAAPLRRDVRSLGRLLGEVLKEQVGQTLFDRVEHLRLLAIEHRELQPEQAQRAEGAADPYQLMERARQFVSQVSVSQAHQLTKAFATYFELINLAETNHRKRRRRAAEVLTHHAPQAGSIRDTLLRMREAGINAEAALEQLRRITITPVFTAHPTEVARRTVLFKRQRIAAELEKLDQLPLPDTAALRAQEAIFAEITALWQADEVRRRMPTVRDEI